MALLICKKKYMCSIIFKQQKMSFFKDLKKGAYCFATVGRSVGWSVGRSVDQVLSAQYLLTPSLDQYQSAGVALNK